MTQKPVLKILEAGKTNISSTDPRDFKVYLPKYPCLKIHEIKSGQISINSGDSVGSVTFSHNLGYVPAFLVYQEGYGWELFPNGIEAYATTNSIVVTKRLSSPYNQEITTYQASQIITTRFGGLPSYDFLAGKILGSNVESAYWFENIYVNRNQTVNAANFELKDVYTTSGADIKFKMWGIDEDNTADLGGGYPGGRPKTDAVRTKTQSPITSKFNYGDEIKDLVQEIVNRSGWNNGNHMCFVIENNDTPDGKGMAGDHTYSNLNVELKITLTGTGYLNTPIKVVILKDKIA